MPLSRFSVTFSAILIILTFLQIVPATSDRLLIQQKNQTQPTSTSNNHQQRMADVPVINMTFEQYKQLYGKKYSSVAEETYRSHVFARHLKKLNAHNQNASRTYNMKPNHLFDMTTSEFKELFTGTKQSTEESRNISDNCLHKRHQRKNNNLPEGQLNSSNTDGEEKQDYSADRPRQQGKNNTSNQHETTSNSSSRLLTSSSNSSEPSNQTSLALSSASNIDIDWSLYAGSIKYQGYCGACYAFTAVDTLSAIKAINQYGFFISLSVQQIIDCSNNGLTFGCSGGYLQGAFTYIQLNGINSEHAYPYSSATSGKAGKCESTGGPFKLTSFNSISDGDCNAVINSLALGPVSAGIAGYNLQFYDSGVFNDCNQVLDHAIVIVGFKSGVGWRIKNSWGVQWGDSGFGWIAQGNTCGICNMAVSVVS